MIEVPDAIILCGGAGLRLRPVIGDLPKSMAEVAGRPFLELLLLQLSRNRIQRAILATGYRSEAIISHFGSRALGLGIDYSVELSPMGTGGALRKAAELSNTENILVMNGDSYTNIDLAQFIVSHLSSKSDGSVVVVPSDGRGDCGRISLGHADNIVTFHEKQVVSSPSYNNAGIYLLSRQLVNGIPQKSTISLEQELIPDWLKKGVRLRAFVSDQACVDIGTPDRYQSSQSVLAEVESNLTGRPAAS